MSEEMKLLPCPFCNSDEIESHADKADGWVIYCGNCTASLSEAQEAFAISAWNRRAIPADAKERALREALTSADSWLERWASHVGNCKGGDECTCGLTLIRFEARAALAQG